MDQGSPNWNPPPILNKAWMEYVDSLYPSPSERAAEVHGRIDPDISQFDLLCFAIEYASGTAVGLFSDTELLGAMKIAARWLYATHYFGAPDIYGPPELKRDSKERDGDTGGILPISQGDKPPLRSPETSGSGAGEGAQVRGSDVGPSPETSVSVPGSDVRGSVQPGLRAHSEAEDNSQRPPLVSERSDDTAEVSPGHGEESPADSSMGKDGEHDDTAGLRVSEGDD